MSSFFPTAFEKIWKFLLQPSFFPGHPVFVSPFLKKIWIFCSYSVSYQEDAIFFSWLKKSWLFSWITIFRSSCGSHIVHMQKIRNRSNFFQKIFPHRVYCQKIWNCYRFLEKNLPHRVYFQNFWNRSRFSKLFSKNLSLASSGRPDIGISTILYAPIRQIRQISPLPGLFPKQHPVVLLLSEKIPKNIISHHWLSQLPPLFCNTHFQLFLKKICPSSADYHIFSAFCFCILEKKLKNLTDRE